MKKRKKLSLEQQSERNGFIFVLPWFIGFVLFFLYPVLQSLLFCFTNVDITTNGFKLSFIGLDNFDYAFFRSPQYVDNLVDTLSSFAYQIPIVMILSLIIAIVLNPKFKGRTFFRGMFFIPVIISTGVVMQYIAGNSSMGELRNVSSDLEANSVYLSGLIDFNKVFEQLNLPSEITKLITGYVNDIFDLVWNCGIQILLFICGLQTIPDQLYEVSRVEGATKWEEFWYITFPSLGNTIVLVLVFTAIDFCVNTGNKVMSQAYEILMKQQVYGKSAAMMWSYFAVAAIIIGVVFVLFYKYCLKKWEN